MERKLDHLVVAVKTTEGGRWVLPQVLEAARRGTAVTVITPRGDGRLVRELDRLCGLNPRIRHAISPFDFAFRRPLLVARGLWRLRRMIRDLEPDVVLYHLFATAIAFRIAAFGLPTRRVHMVAGPLYLESRLIKTIERAMSRLDDLIICGSQYTRERYRELGVAEDRMEVIPYGVDTVRYTPEARATIAPSVLEGIDSDSFVVIMVAYVYAPKMLVYRGDGIKGHRYLMEAWSRFQAAHPRARLLLVGGGFDDAGESYRQRLVEQFGGSQALRSMGVTWLDSITDVRNTYFSADVSVSPSLSENHGAALEASSMSLPCIVSNAGALPEAVSELSGWVCEAGSAPAIEASLEEAYQAWADKRLPAMGAAARSKMMAEYDERASARRLMDRINE